MALDSFERLGLRTLPQRHIRLTIAIWIIGALVPACTLLFATHLNAGPNETFLTTLIGANVQLLGFGGIVLAFLFPQQRSLILRLKRVSSTWVEKYESAEQQPLRDVAEMKRISRNLIAANSELISAIDSYLLTIVLFGIAFLMLGTCLILLLFHLSFLGHGSDVFSASLFFAELSLASDGVAVLLFAFFVGIVIYWGPTTSELRAERKAVEKSTSG